MFVGTECGGGGGGAAAEHACYTDWGELKLHVARHTSHITHHTSHITHHPSHITYHPSHVTRVLHVGGAARP